MTTALKMLRENGNKFDLIICGVHMPDIDGFKLLELLGLEMDLPVIMMSANSDPNLVMKGITHGACDYLVKPVRLQELRNIWQHVIRKKKVESDHNENASEDPNTQIKPRVIWSIELHKKFVAAVNQLGIDKAVPKRILDLMNVEGLTRENVASHLQKYRLYLSRISLQQANRVATFGVMDAYIRMSSIDGRLPDAALSSYPPSGIQGRLNSTSGVSFHGLAPSTLIQPNRTQNLSYSLNNSQPVVSSAGQISNLYPRIPSSFEFDQLQTSKSITQIGDFNSSDDPRIFTASSTFKDARAAAGVFSNSLPTSNPMILQGTPKTLGDFLITSSMKYLFLLLLLLLLFLYFFFVGKEFGTPGELGFRGGRGIKFIPFQMQLLDHAE